MQRSHLALLLTMLLVDPTLAIAQSRQRPGGPPPPPPPPPPVAAPGSPLPGLNATNSAAFQSGLAEFTDVEGVADGLGPVFNGRSCAECHSAPAVGGGSTRLVTRFGTTTNGVFDPLASLGGSLVEDQAIGPADGSPHAFKPETVPALATIVAHRRTTPLFGDGLIDATPDSTFIALAADEASHHDGTAGRVAMVQNISAGMATVGKFGWKAQNPTLFQFAGDAYLNEMGITSPQFPNENCPQGNCAELAFNPQPTLNDLGDGPRALADYMSLLAPPAPLPATRDTTDGEAIFDRIGCNACHTDTLQTGPNSIGALNRRTYHPYSDFLLHDMGTLGDGIEQGSATGRDMRTAPLWGLHAIATFLHDGRATTIGDAILAHDGQGRASRDRYTALDPQSRNKLLAFLRSL